VPWWEKLAVRIGHAVGLATLSPEIVRVLLYSRAMSVAPVWQSSDEQLLADLGALETPLHATWAQMLAVVGEIDSRGIATAKGYGSTAELVRAVARVPRSEARARVDAAADVLPTRGLDGASLESRLPETAVAVASMPSARRMWR